MPITERSMLEIVNLMQDVNNTNSRRKPREQTS